ncbi:sigma-70 family RNA polymerase sigma factor [Nonomuraea diastatica]|uniref:Sigma-70 family RNA polymerase sigma factor n=1 Tax=Nonomuraea diastatica TaxID=1848329 RepID=A0A4R4WV98_9ACTN|nr:sigma-70 family RNA polymerase sigma factor [Nonomuraea diastatica]TDD21616.1 sigma-70 family RNA polymerase sigma factor [Nonomuraea diastatica]
MNAVPEPTELPEPFRCLADLADGPASVERVKRLTEALAAVPELQRWLREQRQTTVRMLHERDGVSYTHIAGQVGVTPERISAIARGHSRSGRRGRRGAGVRDQSEAL